MDNFIRALLLASLTSFAVIAHADTDFPSLLTLDQVQILRLEDQDKYFSAVQDLLVKIEDMQNQHLRADTSEPENWFVSLFLPMACADNYNDVRRVGGACIYAGNLSKYSRPSGASRPICTPTHQISLGGKTYKCQNSNEVVCNPLAFGFKFTSPEIKATGVSYDNTLKQRDPICVPASVHATKDCKAKAETKYAPAMFRELGLKDQFDKFAKEQIKPFCQSPSRTQALNSSECGAVADSIGEIDYSYRQSDPGPSDAPASH